MHVGYESGEYLNAVDESRPVDVEIETGFSQRDRGSFWGGVVEIGHYKLAYLLVNIFDYKLKKKRILTEVLVFANLKNKTQNVIERLKLSYTSLPGTATTVWLPNSSASAEA